MFHHEALRERQPDARTASLGGEERDEDFTGHFGRYQSAVVADPQFFVSPPYIHSGGLGLLGILYQIDQNLVEEVLVQREGQSAR